MATETNALATAEAAAVTRAPRTIKELLSGEKIRAQIAAALPKHMTADRMIRVALTALMRTPDLVACTQESFFKCLLDCSAMGLEPDGRRAHLIPYKMDKGTKNERLEATLVVDYKGLVDLARRSGEISYIHADVVYSGDQFTYGFGSRAHLHHVPNLEGSDKRSVKAVYSFVRFKDGAEDFTVMSESQVNEIRKKYSKMPNGKAWMDRWGEMAKKTVFRNHSKWLPLPAELRDAVERDDDTELPSATIERATLSLSAVTESADENRGHDATAAPTIDDVREKQQAVATDRAAEEAPRLIPAHVKAILKLMDSVERGLFWRVLGSSGFERIEDVPADVAPAIIAELKSLATEPVVAGV